MKNAAVLFSGGKDSCLALHKIINKYNVKYLLSIIPDNFDSFMFHKPYLALLEEQAEMLDIDLIVKASKGEKDKEINDLRDLINKVKHEIDVIVVGGIASNYQGKRIEKICDELGLEFCAPLWDYDAKKIWKELLKNNFKVILTKVACDGLNKDWLGVVIDEKKFKELEKLSEKYKFRIDFEGGEAESGVLFMPGFKKEIRIKFDVKSEGKYRHFFKNLKVI
jgi:ABC transporter with metal-binding/Fe-S-binding domain ATP-binding protein